MKRKLSKSKKKEIRNHNKKLIQYENIFKKVKIIQQKRLYVIFVLKNLNLKHLNSPKNTKPCTDKDLGFFRAIGISKGESPNSSLDLLQEIDREIARLEEMKKELERDIARIRKRDSKNQKEIKQER